MNDNFNKSTNVSEFKYCLGVVIKNERIKRRLRCEDLAERFAISLNYVNRIIKGNENPSLTILLHIADGLEMNLSELFLEVEKEMKGENENVRSTL